MRARSASPWPHYRRVLQRSAASHCVATRCRVLPLTTRALPRGAWALTHAYEAPRWVRVRQVVQYNMALCVGARHDALHASRHALVRICELLIAAGVDSFGACAPRRVRRPVAEQRKRVQRSGVASLGAWRSRRRGLPGCLGLGQSGLRSMCRRHWCHRSVAVPARLRSRAARARCQCADSMPAGTMGQGSTTEYQECCERASTSSTYPYVHPGVNGRGCALPAVARGSSRCDTRASSASTKFTSPCFVASRSW